MQQTARVMSCIALIVTVATARLEHNFMLEGSFVVPPFTLSNRIERLYPVGEWRPGFGIACNYLLYPLKYLGAGARVSYMRVKHLDDSDVIINAPGLCLLARPRYPFGIDDQAVVFAQIAPGFYRVVGKDTDDTELIKDTFFAFECGAGAAFKSIEGGVLYNLGMDRKDTHNMGWLSIFAALRLPLPAIRR
ncbi:MAG: hypothetical protein GF410_03910 [Chitinivibrionales bacterium]|nr:hypothetical protein [Chitinivibrionales bacterium]